MAEARTQVESMADRAYSRHRGRRPAQTALINVLQDLQAEAGFLPKEGLERVSELMGIPLSHIYGVATFYHQFRLSPRGEHMITVCSGTACHVQGSSELLAELRERFGLKEGADTSTDGKFTVVQVRCLGACGLSPIMKVDDEFYGKVTKTAIPEILAKYGGNAQ